MATFDDIVAPITGTPPSAVAIVRVSGPESWRIASEVFEGSLQARFAAYGRFSTGDDGLAIPFEDGKSFTGEATVEFHVHGSRASIEALIEACVAAGARWARPGEFTERAFLHGRIDLTQAEGIRDSIEAVTDAQMRQANLLREGGLRRSIEGLRLDVSREIAAIDAHVDFSEEIGELDRGAMSIRLRDVAGRIKILLGTAEAGRFLRDGIRIVIAGLPNAGKSSLLNALLGRDRAIVSAAPGTTRDFLEESIELGGVRCVLVDTAGLRTAGDTVEAEGVNRSRRLIESADAVWHVFDAEAGWSEWDEAEFQRIGRPKLKVANKSDLIVETPADSVAVSATSGTGFDRLGDWAKAFSEFERAYLEPLIRPRQTPLLQTASNSIEGAIQTLEHNQPEDLCAVQLREAFDSLGRIIGESASTDMLDQIFRDFCIGK